MPAWRGGYYVKKFRYVRGVRVGHWEIWSKVEYYEESDLAEATWPCKGAADGKILVERLQDDLAG